MRTPLIFILLASLALVALAAGVVWGDGSYLADTAPSGIIIDAT